MLSAPDDDESRMLGRVNSARRRISALKTKEITRFEVNMDNKDCQISDLKQVHNRGNSKNGVL